MALLNFAGLLVIYPGILPTGPVYNLIAVVSMLLGVYAVHKNLASLSTSRLSAVLATGLGATLRVAVMSVVNYSLLPLPPPIGFSMPVPVVVVFLPLIGLFNAAVTLYTVPIAEFVTRSVTSRMHLPAWAFSMPHMKYGLG